MNYYNEWSPYAADWLRNLIDAGLIPPGDVDERSICDVQPEDLEGYTQCHFFAGIGGWSEALRLAAWPTDVPVWTGSCPCQPFSTAGKRLGAADERDLWPAFNNLIQKLGPPVVFGEQVASAIRFGWLDRVYTDLEAAGYACGAAVLGAHSVGAPHIRQRLYWVADAEGNRAPNDIWSRIGQPDAERCRPISGLADSNRTELSRFASAGEQPLHECDRPDVLRLEYTAGNGWDTRRPEPIGGSTASRCGESDCGMGDTNGNGQQPGRLSTATTRHGDSTIADGGIGTTGWLGDTLQPGLEGHSGHVDDGHQPGRLDQNTPGPIATASSWSDFELRACLDGKTRRLKSGLEPLVNGIPFRLADGRTGQAEASRAEILKGIGNSIVPHVAAEFVRCV